MKIGAYEDGEREASQEIIVNLRLKIDNVLMEDELTLTVDYARVVELIGDYTKVRVWKLLEVYVQDLAEVIFEKFRAILEIDVTAVKENKLPNSKAVGVKRIFIR